MTHLRHDQTSRRLRRSGCRKGDHAFGNTQQIGGGIVRRVCVNCSAVSIDLSGAYEMAEPSEQVFARRPPGHRV